MAGVARVAGALRGVKKGRGGGFGPPFYIFFTNLIRFCVKGLDKRLKVFYNKFKQI